MKQPRTMRVRKLTRALASLSVLLLTATPTSAGTVASETTEIEGLKAQMQLLIDQNRQMQETISGLEHEVRAARDEARAAEGLARQARPPVGPTSGRDGAPFSRSSGGMTIQLLDMSLDVLSSFGSSTAEDDELVLLQGGGHDPRQRFFNLQNLELSVLGAVDPYMTGEAHLIYFLDGEGESRFELEEAFASSMQLPFGLHEHGVGLEVGHFFTEFGRINPTHPHAWDWQDQPFVLSRFFGGDGIRAPGSRIAWLTPLPWYSEVHLGVQNAKGETMVSFLANDEVFEERAIGGRPFADRRVSSLSDLVYLARWVNAFDLSETWTTQLGISGLYGPNATGNDASTWIAGMDAVLKWRPLVTDRGWPFVELQGEILYRDYEVDDFFGCPKPEETECDNPLSLGGDILKDWGFYLQALFGFQRNWSAGIRYEYGTGSGDSLGFTKRDEDPFRGDRHRISPLLIFQPSEFSRLRLQYNYDDADFLDDGDAHSLWAGIEFLFGSHPAHSF